jgi:hypothetical protein
VEEILMQQLDFQEVQEVVEVLILEDQLFQHLHLEHQDKEIQGE